MLELHLSWRFQIKKYWHSRKLSPTTQSLQHMIIPDFCARTTAFRWNNWKCLGHITRHSKMVSPEIKQSPWYPFNNNKPLPGRSPHLWPVQGEAEPRRCVSIGIQRRQPSISHHRLGGPSVTFQSTWEWQEEHNEVEFWSSHLWMVLKSLKMNLNSSWETFHENFNNIFKNGSACSILLHQRWQFIQYFPCSGLLTHPILSVIIWVLNTAQVPCQDTSDKTFPTSFVSIGPVLSFRISVPM